MRGGEEADTQLHTVLGKGQLASIVNRFMGLFSVVSFIGIE